jgi:hypothetical protein
VHGGRDVLGVTHGVDGVGDADGGAFTDEAGCSQADLGGDQIEGTALVVLAPPTPVAATVEQSLESLDAEAITDGCGHNCSSILWSRTSACESGLESPAYNLASRCDVRIVLHVAERQWIVDFGFNPEMFVRCRQEWGIHPDA